MDRLFIALWFPEETKEYLDGIIKRYRKGFHNLKWVEGRNLHLTLKFIGEVNSQMRMQIEEVLQAFFLENSFETFELSISGAGVFPSWANPRVVWLGIQPEEVVKRIKGIWEGIEEHLSKAGIQKDSRGFSPHITLARTKRKLPIPEIKRLRSELNKGKFSNIDLKINRICLVKSTLTREGPIYDVIKSYKARRD